MATPDISPAKLAAKLQKKAASVRVADLADAIIRKFGGLEKFAANYVRDYEEANKGSIARSRLLAGALRLVEMTSKKETHTAVEEMSDSELEEQVAKAVRKLLQATPIADMTVDSPQGVAPNGPSTEPANPGSAG